MSEDSLTIDALWAMLQTRRTSGPSGRCLFLVPKAASCSLEDELDSKPRLTTHTSTRLVVDDDVVLLVQSLRQVRPVCVGRGRRRVAEQLPHRLRMARHAPVGAAHRLAAPVQRAPGLAEADGAVVSDCSFVVFQFRNFPEAVGARPGRLRDARAYSVVAQRPEHFQQAAAGAEAAHNICVVWPRRLATPRCCNKHTLVLGGAGRYRSQRCERAARSEQTSRRVLARSRSAIGRASFGCRRAGELAACNTLESSGRRVSLGLCLDIRAVPR